MELNLAAGCLAVFLDDTGDDRLTDKDQKVFGLGGCAVMASALDAVIRHPWRQVRLAVGGSTEARLHATDIRTPSPQQIEAVSNFFRTQQFSRIGAICSIETDLTADITPLVAVVRALGNRIAAVARWQPFTSIEIVFEHSQRLAPHLQKVFADFQLLEDGVAIPVGLNWMHKALGEPALEAADFLANSIGAEARHRIARKPGYAKNFEAFFHDCDSRLMSFIDLMEVRTQR